MSDLRVEKQSPASPTGGKPSAALRELEVPVALHAEAGPSNPYARVHAVLVPGFGGFDALGEVQYYPGTTEAAKAWRDKKPNSNRQRLVLHYFDNLPTAGVPTRAERLLRYLLKRCERNEFQQGDKIALIGHSTGGLDIRSLLDTLIKITDPKNAAKHTKQEIECAQQLLVMIRSVVFLSVPQRGTNIANWMRTLNPVRIPAVSLFRGLVDATDSPLEPGETWFWQQVQAARMKLSNNKKRQRALDAVTPDLYAALVDIATEGAQRTSDDPVKAAKGREALANLELYLGHTHGDFMAIDNLAAYDSDRSWLKGAIRSVQGLFSDIPASEESDTVEFARRSESERSAEIASWATLGIKVLSFATFANPGVPPEEQHDSPKIRSLSAILRLLPITKAKHGDGPYRLAYTACAWGPFHEQTRKTIPNSAPDYKGEGSDFVGARDAAYAELGADSEKIRSWENDGIVNTASMLWPNGKQTLLVQGDHADIIGHYQSDHAAGKEPGRKYLRYDIFSSGSGFDDKRFYKVWSRVFAHCIEALVEEPVEVDTKIVA